MLCKNKKLYFPAPVTSRSDLVYLDLTDRIGGESGRHRLLRCFLIERERALLCPLLPFVWLECRYDGQKCHSHFEHGNDLGKVGDSGAKRLN